MTTQRRTQSTDGDSGLPQDIDALLEKQIKAEQTRKAYQQRPDVMEKRKEYQAKQNDQRKIARAAMKADFETLTGMGYSREQAEAMVEKAKALGA